MFSWAVWLRDTIKGPAACALSGLIPEPCCAHPSLSLQDYEERDRP